MNISALDLGGYYSAGFPIFTGSIVNASGGVLDAAVTLDEGHYRCIRVIATNDVGTPSTVSIHRLHRVKGNPGRAY